MKNHLIGKDPWLLVHTVRTKDIPCDFCDIICTTKESLCSHISEVHSEYFVPQEKTLNENDKLSPVNEEEN